MGRRRGSYPIPTLCAVASENGVERYVVVDVSDWEEIRTEPIGVTAKVWLRPDPDDEANEWLWKEVKTEHSGHRRTLGHDWSERVATDIAGQLGVPSSQVELATRRGVRGVISKNFAPRVSGLRLSNASELLPNVVEGYEAHRTGEVPGYTLEAAFDVLAPYSAHPDTPRDVHDGAATFAGYLMFDALIGNGDRHHDNWGVIDGPGDLRYIAPAFDQATGLGYQEVVEKKAARIKAANVEPWARKGRSRQFEGKPLLVDLAIDALTRIDPAAAESWAGRLASADENGWKLMLDSVPDDLLSQVDRTFAMEILTVNRRRLLDGWHNRTRG